MPRTARVPVRETVRPEPQREPVRVKKTRTHRAGQGSNPMSIPLEILHAFAQAGIDLQWNTEAVLGAPATQFENTRMQQQGWEPVTVGMFEGRLDYLMPKGHKGAIIYGGSRLDWRPMELTHEARTEELQDARRARGNQERQIQSGMIDGVDPDSMDANVAAARPGNIFRKEMAPAPTMAIPD